MLHTMENTHVSPVLNERVYVATACYKNFVVHLNGKIEGFSIENPTPHRLDRTEFNSHQCRDHKTCTHLMRAMVVKRMETDDVPARTIQRVEAMFKEFIGGTFRSPLVGERVEVIGSHHWGEEEVIEIRGGRFRTNQNTWHTMVSDADGCFKRTGFGRSKARLVR